MRQRDEVFNVLLRAQAGVASIDQARSLGFHLSQIAYSRDSGQWRTLLPGIVTTPAVPVTWERDLVAAVLYGAFSA